jgi:segregation and condensation protein A
MTRIEPPEAVTPSQELLVELPVFSGPFRLLAELIMEQKVDVCDVPVGTLTDAFLKRGSEALAVWSLEEATWFLAVCAVLLELKVGRLLPRPPPDSEEDLLGGASPDLLYARTIELAAFRNVSGAIAARMQEASLLVGRMAGPPPELMHLYPDVLAKVSVQDLQRMATALMAPVPPVDLSHVTAVGITVEEALETVQRRLENMTQARFRDLLDDGPDRIGVVVRFLALLELHRQGKVELHQAERFGEIEIQWHGHRVDGEIVELQPHGWDDADDDSRERGGSG